MQRLKILVVYENGAGGHRGSALAIDEALKELADIDSSVLEIDSLAPKSRKKMYSAFMDIRHYFKPVVRFGFSFFALRSNLVFDLYRRFESIVQPYSVRRLLDFIRREQPDLIVSTHFRPNVTLSAWHERGLLRTPVHAAIVDYVAHGMYAHPAISHFYVASDKVRDDLLRHGVDPQRISITGVPTSLTLLRAEERSQKAQQDIRRGLGLDPDLPMILVMGGARGNQEYAAILRHIADRKARVQVVVLCGWNKALRSSVQADAASLPTPIHVKGFERNMVDWYRAADVVLTKPGGMTTTEVMVMQRPMVLLAPAPGKEEVQAERLAAAGAALYEKDPQRAVEAALRLIADDTAQQRMLAAASTLRHPEAAREVAARLAKAARASANADSASD